MFDSPLIEVAIGLSLVFLLLSLLVSSLCEMLAGLFKWRAQYLWVGLETLLQSPEARERLYQHPLLKGLSPLPTVARPVSGLLYKLGLTMGGGPSYIPSRTFALALLDVVREPHALTARLDARLSAILGEGARNPSALASSLAQFLRQAAGDSASPQVAARLQQLQERVFARVDAAVLAPLTREVEAVVSTLPTGAQDSAAPVVAWLEQVDRATTYVELHAALAEAVAAIPTTTPAARECRTALEGVLSRFPHGSPEEIARELRSFLDESQDVRHALRAAGDSFETLAGSLRPLMDEAAGDIDRFRENVERWFNDGMDRVSGAYKRHTLAWQAAIGLALAIAMNVDALQITRTLWHDQALRTVLVAQAEAVAKEPEPQAGLPAVAPERFETIRTQVSALGLPIGWRACEATTAATATGERRQIGTPHLWCEGWTVFALLPMVLGWCLTAAAVSLGAPFWFDTLKRFISIRSAGKAPEERPTPPKEVPRPREPGRE
ncbi:MAG: hypothetical protein AB7N65_02955 [Vicinamibacterales bacterium]